MQFFFRRPWQAMTWPPLKWTALETHCCRMVQAIAAVEGADFSDLAFLSSGGHGTTQLPSEKLLSYSCETSKARIFQNFRDFPEFWWCWKLQISGSTEYLWNVFGISMEYDWNWRFQVQHWQFFLRQTGYTSRKFWFSVGPLSCWK